MSETPEEITTLSYEQARDQLAQVVNKLERGGVTLEESLALWERGEALASRCEQLLQTAKERLSAAQQQQDSSAAHTQGETEAQGSHPEQTAFSTGNTGSHPR